MITKLAGLVHNWNESDRAKLFKAVSQHESLTAISVEAEKFLAASNAMTHSSDWLPGEKRRNYDAAKAGLLWAFNPPPQCSPNL